VTHLTQVADRTAYCRPWTSKQQKTKKQNNKKQQSKKQNTKYHATRGEAIMSRVVNAYGFLARQPRRSGSSVNWVAEGLFFVEVFALSSIALGGAMLLAAAYPDRAHPTEVRVVTDVVADGDDPYLKMFAEGPGCGWYLPPDTAGSVRSCDDQKDASAAQGAGD
jgi:hypothetical protein